MVRSLLIIIYFAILVIFSLFAFPIGWIIGKINPAARDRYYYRIVKRAFKIMLVISGTKLTVKGLENVPEDEAVLYVANHRSYYDIIITYPLVKGLTGYIAKIETYKVPVLRTWMKVIHCQFLDRGDVKKGVKVILDSIEMIKSGISVFIFPEGTRGKVEGEFLPFQPGIFKVADKTGCKIIPVTLNNTREIFETQIPWVRRRHVIVELGEPVCTTDMTPEEKKNTASMIQGIIEETYKRNREEL